MLTSMFSNDILLELRKSFVVFRKNMWNFPASCKHDIDNCQKLKTCFFKINGLFNLVTHSHKELLISQPCQQNNILNKPPEK